MENADVQLKTIISEAWKPATKVSIDIETLRCNAEQEMQYASLQGPFKATTSSSHSLPAFGVSLSQSGEPSRCAMQASRSRSKNTCHISHCMVPVETSVLAEGSVNNDIDNSNHGSKHMDGASSQPCSPPASASLELSPDPSEPIGKQDLGEYQQPKCGLKEQEIDAEVSADFHHLSICSLPPVRPPLKRRQRVAAPRLLAMPSCDLSAMALDLGCGLHTKEHEMDAIEHCEHATISAGVNFKTGIWSHKPLRPLHIQCLSESKAKCLLPPISGVKVKQNAPCAL